MDWLILKSHLLEAGTARLTGIDAAPYVSSSAAGPGAGCGGSVFFSTGKGRVRLSLDPMGKVGIVHTGFGKVLLNLNGQEIEGCIQSVALHCPRQAYITLSGGCVYKCRYCEVPHIMTGRKTPDQIETMVGGVADRIDAISITSGVLHSVAEEEDYTIEVLRRLSKFGIPMGVAIFPGEYSPDRLHRAGVAEVKFNIEAATEEIFIRMCPGLDWAQVWRALEKSVQLFGRGHVFSNLIIGLGEKDEEVETCIGALCDIGVIPILRPLNPAGELKTWNRPSAGRLIDLFSIHKRALKNAKLDPRAAVSMCAACTGCDLVPGWDAPL